MRNEIGENSDIRSWKVLEPDKRVHWEKALGVSTSSYINKMA